MNIGIMLCSVKNSVNKFIIIIIIIIIIIEGDYQQNSN